MTDLLPRGPSTQESLEKRQRAQYIFLDRMIDEGKDYREVAEILSKGDPKKAQRWRRRWRYWMQEPGFQEMLASIVAVELRSGLPSMASALIRRASKGNVPAIKLAFESSGYWSPRSQVEHTGEVSVVLKGVVRPATTQDGSVEIPEADVVDVD